jgi:hypothetical protein
MGRSIGKHPIGYDQRTGRKERFDDLIEDGELPGVRTHRREADREHPQKRLKAPGPDRAAIYKPLPEAKSEAVRIMFGYDVPSDQLWAPRSPGPDFAITFGGIVVTSIEGSASL